MLLSALPKGGSPIGVCNLHTRVESDPFNLEGWLHCCHQHTAHSPGQAALWLRVLTQKPG